MHSEYEPTLNQWRAALRQPGFCFVSDQLMRSVLSSAALAAWPNFAQSWNDLVLDAYMQDNGRYRKRRHAAFNVSASGAITALAAQPHYQSLDYNPLNGGIAREFAPILPANTQNPLFLELLQRFAELVKPLSADVGNWFAEAHQFRIEPTPDSVGLPTPEGVHRDGVDYVLVLMVARENIAAGTTTAHLAGGLEVGSFTLSQPFEAVWLDDTRIFHGVTAVHARNPELPAYRDVLVLTLRRVD
jgi:hypothetical protein